ncbi:unnamed protein product [Eruca vesicaria subsp. sativa]|uniref:CCHC-type domain-containing protein n=1 Tax=Eruca vesicaria subsp. sativa TaxID=29727 RepID=A0ABC8KM57_ERUVS|nr:unnamed protein product [Eruca vesicaria subsp. sativa]
MDHTIQNCTRPSDQSGGSGSVACFQCDKSGHYKTEFPQLQGGQGKGHEKIGKSNHNRPTTTARVYELFRDNGASGSFDSISGCAETSTGTDSGCTYDSDFVWNLRTLWKRAACLAVNSVRIDEGMTM